MIYRVGDSGDPSFDYSSQLKPAKNTESQEKFSLDRQKEQEYSAKKEDKDEDKKLHEKPDMRSRMRDGVRLDLSGGKDTQDAEQKKQTQNAPSASGSSMLSVLQGLIAAVKDFLYRLWNDVPAEPVSEEVTPEEAERYTEEYYAMKGITPAQNAAETQEPSMETPQSYAAAQAAREEKIRVQLRSGNLEQVINLLTDDGRRAVAKNSTLLTYYDKSGKITQINASDRERILHGDRNVRTL